MRGGRAIAIGLAVLVGGTVEAGAQVDDRIVFISTSPASEVHVMNADGTGRTAVTQRAPSGFSAVWSPDGSRFAFNGSSGTSFGLWVMDRDGGNVRFLGFGRPHSEGGPMPDPDWAPGGRRLVVSYARDLYIVNRDGTGRRRLTPSAEHDWSPAWSPNGAWIAFTREGRLYRIRTDGTGLRFLGMGDDADWSPNGKRIVFTVQPLFGGRDIYSMRADGTDRRRLTRSKKDEYAPAWSPGGKRIAYTRGFESDIWVMNPDGSDKHPLVIDAAAASWSPAGAFVSFTRTRTAAFPGSDTGEVAAIWMRPADGSAKATRLLTPEFDLDVDASPDGTRIAYTSVRPFSTSGIYLADADGANEAFLHVGEGPDWSTDGTRILLRSAGRLYVVNSDGSLPTQVPEPAGHDFAFIESWRWHPDGTRVTFVSSGGTLCTDVYAMSLDGTNLTRQTRADCLPSVVDFDWSPNGSMLVFTGFACDEGDCDPEIFSAAAPDGLPTSLASAFPFLTHPRVSPDGAKVLFVRYGDFSETAVWSMNIDGSGQRQLIPMGTGAEPAWLAAH
jgi:TolB protein